MVPRFGQEPTTDEDLNLYTLWLIQCGLWGIFQLGISSLASDADAAVLE